MPRARAGRELSAGERQAFALAYFSPSYSAAGLADFLARLPEAPGR